MGSTVSGWVRGSRDCGRWRSDGMQQGQASRTSQDFRIDKFHAGGVADREGGEITG